LRAAQRGRRERRRRLQETLLTLRDYAGRFRPRLQPDADALHWILRVAANTALELRRRRRRARRRDASAAPLLAACAPDADHIALQEVRAILRDAIAGLNEAERTAIVLRVMEGMDYLAIAASLGCAEGTVKSHVSRGLQRLRKRLHHRELTAPVLAALLPPASGTPSAMPAWGAHLLQAHQTARVICIPGHLGSLSMATSLGIVLVAMLGIGAQQVLHAASTVEAAPASPPLAVAPTPTPTLGTQPLPQQAVHPHVRHAFLQEHISFAFDQTPLADVLAFLGQVTEFTLAIDPALAAPIKTVTLKVDQIRMDHALRLVFHRSHIRISLRGQVLHIDRIPDGTPMSDDEALRELPLDQASLEVRQQLEQQVHIEFTDTATGDALTFLQRITTMNVVVEPTVEVGALPTITLHRDHTPLSVILAEVCRQSGLTASWENEAIVLSRSPVSPPRSLMISPALSIQPPLPHEPR